MARLVVVFCILLVMSGTGAVTAVAAPAPPSPQVFRAGLDRPGPYAVASTTQVKRCIGPEADAQNADARRQGAFTPLLCTPASPIGRGPDTGVDFYYPTSAPGKRPLVVFMPGNRANPGYFAPVARHWASYGFIVAIAYKATEIAPDSTFLGFRRAIAENNNRKSPIYNRIDLQSVIISGHSSGATKAIEVAGIAGAPSSGIRVPREYIVPPVIRIIGVVALAPDFYTVPTPVKVPTLILTGSADTASFAPVIEPVVYAPITEGPAWLAVARGAAHLTVVNPVDKYPLTGVAVEFLRYLTGDAAACRSFAGPGWTLPADRSFTHVIRNARARATTCTA